MSKLALYVQYTNPAAYPPLEHSSIILARAGWRVIQLGVRARETDCMEFPEGQPIEVRRMEACASGFRQKWHFVRFVLWSVWTAVRLKPDVTYFSDMLSTPSGLLVSLVTNSFVVYHEHDSPNPEGAGGRTGFQKLLRWTRRLLVRRAGAVVLPNAERAAILVRETGLINPAIVIWNCPRLDEVGGPRVDPLDRIWLFYHGSLGPERLPVHIIDVLARLPERVGLRVVGYETLGSVGYLDRLRARARALGCAHRLETPGTIPTRRELLAICRASDIGMALMPMDTKDINLKAMTGASNKVFDYMASGLALIVSDLPDWRLTFCDEGLAVPCDPRRVDHLAAAIEGLVGDPVRLRQMGERGRQRVVRDWNYEAQMQPLLDLIAKRRQSLDS